MSLAYKTCMPITWFASFFQFWVISWPYIITSKLRGYYLVVKVLVQLVATELERLEFFMSLMYFNSIHQVFSFYIALFRKAVGFVEWDPKQRT